MTITSPRRPGGFVELLPAEQRVFQQLLDIIRTSYELYGFTPIDTPDIELSEVLLAKGGGETEQQVYRFQREGSKTDLTLRYDLTVPLARYAAEHESELTFPFRRYHIGKVHRAERQQKGRFREFYQCDIDAIGTNSPLTDAEFPAIINHIFSQFHIGEFTIHINNRKLISGLIEAIGLGAVVTDVLHLLDKIDKISPDAFVSGLQSIGAEPVQIEQLVHYANLSGSTDEVLEALASFAHTNPTFQEGLSDLRTIMTALKTMDIPASRYRINTRIVRGLDYYTGTVYETFLDDFPALGSVCSGGRYDNLADNYTKTSLSGVGISIGLTRLFDQLRDIPGFVDYSRQTSADVLVIPVDEAQLDEAVRSVSALRAAGIPTILYAEQDKMKKKLRYADRIGVPFVAIIGEEEASRDVLTVKDMNSGASDTLSRDALIERVRA